MATKTKYTCLDWQFCEVNFLNGNFAKPIVCNGKQPIFSYSTYLCQFHYAFYGLSWAPALPEPTFAATIRIRMKKLHLYLFLLCIVQLIFCCAFCSLDLSLNILRLHCCKIVTTLEVDTLYVNYISMLQFEIPAVVDYAMCIILFTFGSYNSLDLYNKIVYLSRT